MRLAAWLDDLAHAAGRADRHESLKDYCKGLLLPGERKSIELMAARLHPGRVQAAWQSLPPLVAKAPWDDEAVLREVRRRVMPRMQQRVPIVAWIVDDTGIPKKGRYSVGVARQDCGQLGKQDNCQVAVRLSVATREASLPVGWRLSLPEEWARDRERRRRAGGAACVPNLARCGSGRRTGTTGAASLTPGTGCRWSGREGRKSRRNTGCRICLPGRRRGVRSSWPGIAGWSSATIWS